MASADRYIAAQNGAVRLALRDLEALWGRMQGWDALEYSTALEEIWPTLVERYGEMTATIAADRFESITGMTASLSGLPDAEVVNARMRWGLSPMFGGAGSGAALARLAQITDELVKQPGRDTMIKSAANNEIRYARVPSGKHTCAFCLMIASRGPVYVTGQSAGRVTGVSLGGRDYKRLRRIGDTVANREAISRGRKTRAGTKRPIGSKFHGECDCRIEPVADDGDLQRLKRAGYDPDELRDIYDASKATSDGGAVHIKDTLANIRAEQGTH